MKGIRFGTLALALLTVSALLSGCEKSGDGDVNDPKENLEENPVAFDNKPGHISTDPRPSISLSPVTSSILEPGDTIVFTASGGYPPYTWGIGNQSNGYIDVQDGNPCFYTALKAKQNSVYVKDSRGKVASATIVVAASL